MPSAGPCGESVAGTGFLRLSRPLTVNAGARHLQLGALSFLFAVLLVAAPLYALPDTSPDALLREHLWRQVTTLPKGQRPAVGLVLSAGALRGLAHVGVLQVLEDADFPVDVVAGTSAGAVLGSFYAAGISMPRMWGIRNTLRLQTGSNFSQIRLVQLMLADHLLSSGNMEKTVRDMLGDITFDRLQKPFGCVAMDLKTGEKIVFRSGPVAPAVRASMNLPGIFEPVVYRHRYLVDGGVVDYVPVDVARFLGAEWVLASVTEGDFTNFTPTNVLSSLEQVIDIRGALLAQEQKKHADALIEPKVDGIGFTATERIGEAMDKGVLAARRDLRAVQEKYILFALPRIMPGPKP